MVAAESEHSGLLSEWRRATWHTGAAAWGGGRNCLLGGRLRDPRHLPSLRTCRTCPHALLCGMRVGTDTWRAGAVALRAACSEGGLQEPDAFTKRAVSLLRIHPDGLAREALYSAASCQNQHTVSL